MLPKKWLLGIVSAFTALNALQPISDINVSGGYRNDRFRTRVTTETPDGIYTGQDMLNATNLNIWQIGTDGVLRLPNLFLDRCGCNTWWLGQFYIRGSAYWGTGSQGHLKEEAKDDFEFIVVDARGKIHKTRTFDYNGGIGWLFSCNRWFAIGPVVGISYNRLYFRANMDDFDPLDGMSFTSRFHTTFVGLDALVDTGCIYMRAGYEYHFLNKWTGNFKVRGDVVNDFSFNDRRRSHDGYGHLLYLEARMPICDYYWEWGVKGQMSFRRVRRASCNFYDTHGVDVPIAHTKYAKWFSLSIVADLGYNF